MLFRPFYCHNKLNEYIMIMSKGDFNSHWQVIVVGGSADEFVRHTTDLLDRHDIEYALCDEVYSAICESAKSKVPAPASSDASRGSGPNILVIGRFGQLSKEQGRFFHIASEKGYRYCCLVDRDPVRNHKQILAAFESGAFIINKPEEIEEVVVKLLVDNRDCSPVQNANCKASNFIKEEFLTTKAELDALLEVQLDEKT